MNKTYEVEIGRDVRQIALVVVTAKNEAEAWDKAWEVAGRNGENLDAWEWRTPSKIWLSHCREVAAAAVETGGSP
jgi:hypothetical protein